MQCFSGENDDGNDSDNGCDGIVCIGTGGDLQSWVDGVKGEIKKLAKDNGDKDTDFNIFQEPFSVVTSGGRIDLVFPFKKDAFSTQNSGNLRYNNLLGKIAVWRIQFGDCTWISDYIINYINHHPKHADVNHKRNREEQEEHNSCSPTIEMSEENEESCLKKNKEK